MKSDIIAALSERQLKDADRIACDLMVELEGRPIASACVVVASVIEFLDRNGLLNLDELNDVIAVIAEHRGNSSVGAISTSKEDKGEMN